MASSFPEILEDLEKRLGAFTISNGAGVTVEGNFDKGFAVNIRKQVAEEIVPTGACCLDGACSITTEAACNFSGGTYQGDDTVCSPNPCPPVGACCVDSDCSIETEDDCTGMGGVYQGDDTVCDPNPCTGGCCIDDICSVTTESDCNDAGGTFLGAGTDCDDPDACCCPFFNDITTVTLSGSITGCSLGDITFGAETWTKVSGATVLLDEFTIFGCALTAGIEGPLCNLQTPNFMRTIITDCSTSNVASLTIDFLSGCGPNVFLAGCAVDCNAPDDTICYSDFVEYPLAIGVNDFSISGFGLTYNFHIVLA